MKRAADILVEVVFLIPGVGRHIETYDRRVVDDVKCWRTNGATYPILSQRAVSQSDYEEADAENMTPTEALIKRAATEARAHPIVLRTSK